MSTRVRQVRAEPRIRSGRPLHVCCRLVALLLALGGAPAQAEEPVPVPVPDPAPADAPLFSIGSPIGPFEYRPGRGLRVGNTGLNIGGFSTVEFDREDSGALEIELDSINFLILYEPTPLFKAFVELEIDQLYAYEDAGGDVDSKPDVKVERLHGDLSLNDAFNFRAGKFQTPVGRWNLVPAEPFVWTANEPVLIERAFDEFQTGGALYGTVYPGAGTLEYWLYGQFSHPLDGDDDEDLADRSVGGRLEYGTPLRGWSFGASFLASQRNRDWSHLGGLDARWTGDRFELQTEFVYQQGDIPDRDLWGVFVEGVYEVVPNFYLVGRYEYFDPTGANQDPHIVDLGVAVIPKPWLHLKLTYRAASQQTDDAARGLSASISVVF